MRFSVLIASTLVLSAPAFAAEDGAKLYAANCASCHGDTGQADSPTAQALLPRPASFADPEFWKTRDDAAVKEVIKNGGAAVGKSPMMIAWGATLNDAQIDAIIAFLKTLKK
jgi:mono/diheme cytochrome c family protein